MHVCIHPYISKSVFLNIFTFSFSISEYSLYILLNYIRTFSFTYTKLFEHIPPILTHSFVLCVLLCFIPRQFYLYIYAKYKRCIHVFPCFVTKHSWCYCTGLPTAGVTGVCYHAQIFYENVIWNSLINSDVEYFVIHLFTSWISYFENCLF